MNVRPTISKCGKIVRDCPTKLNGSASKTYLKWEKMIKKAYGIPYDTRNNQSGITVCDDWLTQSNFERWLTSGGNEKRLKFEFHISNAWLGESLNHYSPEETMLVPPEMSRFNFADHNWTNVGDLKEKEKWKRKKIKQLNRFRDCGILAQTSHPKEAYTTAINKINAA